MRLLLGGSETGLGSLLFKMKPFQREWIGLAEGNGEVGKRVALWLSFQLCADDSQIDL